MTHTEFTRLRTLENMSRRQSSYSNRVPSRRSAKGKGKGFHTITKNSRVHYQVGLEVVFNTPGWTKRNAAR